VKCSFLLFFLGAIFLCLGAGGASSDVLLTVWLGIAILVTPVVTLFLYRSICLRVTLNKPARVQAEISGACTIKSSSRVSSASRV